MTAYYTCITFTLTHTLHLHLQIHYTYTYTTFTHTRKLHIYYTYTTPDIRIHTLTVMNWGREKEKSTAIVSIYSRWHMGENNLSIETRN